MLKKITVDHVRIGMHIHKLEGAWLSHPFWKTRFVLDDPADLQRLRDSGVPAVWIDPALGVDVAVPDAEVVPPPAAPPAAPAPAAPAQGSKTLRDELDQAAAICKKSRVAVMQMFAEARLGKAVDTEQCLPLVDEIAESVFRNPGALVSLARLKTADDYTYMHSLAVCALMVSLARTLGQDDAACREAGLAGMLHDLGKAVMPTEVLNKPGRLTEDEYAIMKTHPVRGHELLMEARGAPEAALEVCLHHHERPDGRGYPHGLSGERLSLLARMGAVCDVYDAITSNRPYKTGWDPAESIALMASWQGQFDPEVFKAFVRSLGIYPTGSLVRLASGKLAVVLEQNEHSLTSPVVKVFFSITSNMGVSPRRLDLAHPGCTDRIVGREDPAKWGFKQIDELWVEGDVLKRSR
ncbi:MAG: HD-GYP domain-containing protein [Burkholderiaceae bacterium]|nr:HD-GYP domain-containing protein [Burkholderiaceae bacterium]